MDCDSATHLAKPQRAATLDLHDRAFACACPVKNRPGDERKSGRAGHFASGSTLTGACVRATGVGAPVVPGTRAPPAKVK